jgi:amino acid transporter
MASEKPMLFVRESTGLVKNVSLLDAIAINVSYMSVGAALALVGFSVSSLPTVYGLNLVMGSIIAFALIVPQIVVYTMMSRRILRTGGDYVWVSRSLGGFIGSTFTFMGITVETMPYLALIALSFVFALSSIGLILGIPALQALSSPFLESVVASLTFASLIALNIFAPRAGYKLITTLMLYGVFSLVLSLASLVNAGRSGVESYINSLGLSYSSIATSYKGPLFNFYTTLLFVPFYAIFSYPWFNAAPSVGAEIKGERATKWNVPISALLTFLFLTIPFGVMYLVAGFDFTTAALSNPTLTQQYSFNFWTLAMGVSRSFALKALIATGWILWTLAILAFGIITISRYMLAQAFDRYLPETLAYVNKYGSPVTAHLVDLVVTIALIWSASYFYGTLSSLYGAVLASMIYFAVVGIGALFYAQKRERGRARLVLTISGALMALVFLFISYEFVAYQSVWGGNALAYGYIVASFVVGSLLYLRAKFLNKRKGIEISQVFKEIPPE